MSKPRDLDPDQSAPFRTARQRAFELLHQMRLVIADLANVERLLPNRPMGDERWAELWRSAIFLRDTADRLAAFCQGQRRELAGDPTPPAPAPAEPTLGHPWAMADLRRWMRSQDHVPGDFPVSAVLPERPRNWAVDGSGMYHNDVLALTTYDPKDFE